MGVKHLMSKTTLLLQLQNLLTLDPEVSESRYPAYSLKHVTLGVAWCGYLVLPTLSGAAWAFVELSS